MSTIEKFNKITESIVGSDYPKTDKLDISCDSEVFDVENNDLSISQNLEYNIPNLFTDFEQVRHILTKQSQKTIEILDAVTDELKINPQDSLLLDSYASLNKALNDTTRLFVNSYKELASVFSTISKMKISELECQQREQTIQETKVTSEGIIKHISGLIGVDNETSGND